MVKAYGFLGNQKLLDDVYKFLQILIIVIYSVAPDINPFDGRVLPQIIRKPIIKKPDHTAIKLQEKKVQDRKEEMQRQIS